MMTKPKFIIGDELFVRNPTRYLKGCVSITGDVVEIESIGSSFMYRVMAEVVYPYPRQHWHGRIEIFEVDLDHRIVIPFSQLDGRTGGNAAWRSLSDSWLIGRAHVCTRVTNATLVCRL